MAAGNATTRTEALMDAVRGRIASRSLAPGERLPSVRGFATAMQVSPSTVVEAYGRLEAEGVIRARRGSGFYVTGAASSAPPPERGSAVEREIDPFWVSRQALDADPSVLKPGCGWLPADWMPEAALSKELRALARAGGAPMLEYGRTRGSPALRQQLLRRFGEEGIAAAPDQIMLTGSATQAVDLICRLLLRPGNTVLVDDPCYFNFQALLRSHRARIVGVPFTPSGPDAEAFERAAADNSPRLYLTNSALHNPTGATLSPRTAHRILGIAAAHGMTIVEDDIFADFEPAFSPRLAVLDGLDRVIRIGSFSKTLSASARCGYIAARADWIDELADLQVATNFGGPSPMATEMIAGVLAGGSYLRHMDEVRRRLARARKLAMERLAGLGLRTWTVPRGGFYLWCQLPGGQGSAAVARKCMERNVLLAPGNAFSVSGSAASFLRVNVAHLADERVFTVLKGAMEDAGPDGS